MKFLFLFFLLAFIDQGDFSIYLNDSHLENQSSQRPLRYIFYDVNPPEGFNLRRDVYLRMAVFISEIQEKENWVLVLPPWPKLYHWRSPIPQERLPWSHFFDLASLQKFAHVIETLDFLDMQPNSFIDHVYILQHFEEMFRTSNFIDKVEHQPCTEQHRFMKSPSDGKYYNTHSSIGIGARKVECLSFHGSASLLGKFLKKTPHNIILLDHAEVPLHDRYGDEVYWQARRSMRFSPTLMEIATNFRKEYLNSTDTMDNTYLPHDWTLQKPYRRAIGGPYLSIHLRRRDFLHARSSEVPSLRHAVDQIKTAAKELELNTVFIATDAPIHELNELETLMAEAELQMVSFRPSTEQLPIIKDGGAAIIDQIISSYARQPFHSESKKRGKLSDLKQKQHLIGCVVMEKLLVNNLPNGLYDFNVPNELTKSNNTIAKQIILVHREQTVSLIQLAQKTFRLRRSKALWDIA